MSKEMVTAASAETLAALAQAFPQDPGYIRLQLPRLAFVSQDKTEGKGKTMKVVMEAGTFLREEETDELNEEGKKIWSKTELGLELDGIIIYQRKQLRYYDETTEEFTSSPIFDTEDEIVPLFCNKKEITRGTPAELKAKYEFVDSRDGKTKSKLEENRILYVLIDGKLHQLSLRGSSMYSFLSYARTLVVPSVVTHFASEPKEKGSIAWNQMTFKPVRQLNNEEAQSVLAHIAEIREGIEGEKAFFHNQVAKPAAVLLAGDPNDF